MFANVASIVHAGLNAGLGYLRRDPLFPLRAARNAARLEMTIPLDLVRYAIDLRPRGKGPERIEIAAAPPGLSVNVTQDLFGTKLDVALHVDIDGIYGDADALKLTLRVRDLSITAPPGSPAQMMLGALDLSKPAGLLRMVPMKMDALVEADGDRFVLDLFKIKGIARQKIVRRVLAVADGAARIREVRTEGDVLVIGFGVTPAAIPGALLKLRSA